MEKHALNFKDRMQPLDWAGVDEQLCENGFALLEGLLTPKECSTLKAMYNDDTRFRATIDMSRYRFGEGEYRYFNYPLPEIIQQLRTLLYPHLVKTANKFVKAMNLGPEYPPQLADFLAYCHNHDQNRPTPLILKYAKGGYNTLHQDLYGEIHFPFQAVLFLDRPHQDYGGGEFVMTEQRPRAQSKAEVLQPGQGDVLIFTTNYRPVKGKQGYYKVAMRHGVSKVRWGERHTAGVIFHDAR